MPKRKLGHDKYSFTEMYDSLTERSYADLSDEKLKKLYNQMKDEQLSPVAGQQFKMIVKAMKAKKIPLNEKAMKAGDTEAYKRYLITATMGGDFIVTKDKTRIVTSKTLDAAKKEIDGLTESAGDAKNYLTKKVIKQMIDSGKWEVDSGDANGKTGSSLIMKSHTGKKRAVIIEAMASEGQRSRENGIKIISTALKGIQKMRGGGKNQAIGRLIDESTASLMTILSEWKNTFIGESALDEDATANAKKSLDAIVGHLEKRKKSGADVLGATGRSMLTMGTGIQASFKQEGGFSPDQAKWIWKTSLALFKQ